MEKINEITQRENNLLRRHYGRIPEANDEFNNLQRELIAAVYAIGEKAYVGKITYYGSERGVLSEKTVFTEYTGQMIYNFGADFVVPAVDNNLAKMIVELNTGSDQSIRWRLLKRIYNKIESLGGKSLLWS